MRIGVISDVHANAPALEAVLTRLDTLGVERILSAGDIVGYYPFPNEAISLFKGYDIDSVVGNHDAAIIDHSSEDFNITAKRAIDWTRRELSTSSLEYLKTLPLEIDDTINSNEVYMVHGSPRQQLDEYIWEEDLDKTIIDSWFPNNPDLVILGHTHRPYEKTVGSTTILNPGSVGQPRDGEPKAAFATVDMGNIEVNRYRIDYDIDSVVERTLEFLPRELADRLYDGR